MMPIDPQVAWIVQAEREKEIAAYPLRVAAASHRRAQRRGSRRSRLGWFFRFVSQQVSIAE